MAFWKSFRESGEWLDEFFGRGCFVEFDAFDGDACGEGIVLRTELKAENPKTIFGCLIAREFDIAWLLEIGEAFLEIEEHVP